MVLKKQEIDELFELLNTLINHIKKLETSEVAFEQSVKIQLQECNNKALIQLVKNEQILLSNKVDKLQATAFNTEVKLSNLLLNINKEVKESANNQFGELRKMFVKEIKIGFIKKYGNTILIFLIIAILTWIIVRSNINSTQERKDALKYKILLKFSKSEIKQKYHNWDSACNKISIHDLEEKLKPIEAK